jgi:hypothetical protein
VEADDAPPAGVELDAPPKRAELDSSLPASGCPVLGALAPPNKDVLVVPNSPEKPPIAVRELLLAAEAPNKGWLDAPSPPKPPLNGSFVVLLGDPRPGRVCCVLPTAACVLEADAGAKRLPQEAALFAASCDNPNPPVLFFQLNSPPAELGCPLPLELASETRLEPNIGI